ncbi:MAG: glycosyltransferase family 2 protein [Microthrixaceae bacterium]|nr:glycosyltransferase family 2 protein [Microthrixaceae bacterium]
MTSAIGAVGATGVIAVLGYTLYTFVLGRRTEVERAAPVPADHLFVFVIPAHNEETVIASTVERLLTLPGERHAVLVVDDGSTDSTAEVVRRFDPRRVWLHRRHHPAAALGKGEALNDAYRELLRRLEGRNLHRVILCVLDADGVIDEHCLDEVEARFVDPELVALQLRVRIHNRDHSWLARMQDVEFCAFSDVYQLGRDTLGTPGLGGNGQFVRLGALSVLGDSPWTDSLTEDLAMGLELAAHGWKLGFCGDAAVHQQGLESIRPLLRQRTRWFQGQLQCLRLLGRIVRSSLPARAKVDLVFHLTNALFTLVAMVASTVWLGRLAVLTIGDSSVAWGANLAGGRWLIFYLLAFPLAPVISVVYLRREPTIPLWRAVAAGHLYVLYSYLWLPAGIGAIARMLRGHHGWAKTERLSRTPDEDRRSPSGFEPQPLPGWEQSWRPLSPSAAHRGRVIDLRSTAPEERRAEVG